MKNFLLVISGFVIALVIGGGIYMMNQPKEAVDMPNSEVCGQGGCINKENVVYGTQTGTVIENYELTDFDGNTVNLYDLVEGYDQVVIALEAQWCEDCHRQDSKMVVDGAIPEGTLFIPIYTTYTSASGDPLKVGEYEAAKAYTEERYAGTNITPYWDTDDIIFDAFKAVGTPTNIMLDENGFIKSVSLEIDADNLLLDNKEASK